MQQYGTVEFGYYISGLYRTVPYSNVLYGTVLSVPFLLTGVMHNMVFSPWQNFWGCHFPTLYIRTGVVRGGAAPPKKMGDPGGGASRNFFDP